MFPQIILETFSVSSNEISYFISEAVDPYFNTINIEDVKKSRCNFETDVLQKNYVLFKIMKYHYHHQRPLEIMVEMLIKLSGMNKMNKSHQKEKGKI